MLNEIRNRADWSDKSSSQKGFTLIELLVVIAILGVLAVVGVLSFGGLTDSAKKSTAKTELTQVQAAVDAYTAKHGAPPADGTLNLANLQTAADPFLKATATFQCKYTITSGDVSFDALVNQSDKNCA